MNDSVLDESSLVLDSIDDSEVTRVTSEEDLNSIELAVTPVGDSSINDLDESQEELEESVDDYRVLAADPVGDTENALILAKLESIDMHIRSGNSTMSEIDTDVYNIGEGLSEYFIIQSHYTDTVTSYLSNFFELFITVLAVIVVAKMAKWIEWLFTDR